MDNPDLVGAYTFNGILINDRPLYVEREQQYAIWYASETWIIGEVLSVENGNSLTWGLAVTYDFLTTACPMSTVTWWQYWDEQWTTTEIIVECTTG